jgi:hypothetical protein
MNDWNTMFSMAQEHCNDLRRYAETERMLRAAFREERRLHSFRCRALCRLGRWLMALGARLEETHGGATDTPALRPAPTQPG